MNASCAKLNNYEKLWRNTLLNFFMFKNVNRPRTDFEKEN